MRILLITAITLTTLAGSPALAGKTSMSHADGTKLRIICTGSSCKVRAKKPGGSWGQVEKTSGGKKGHEALEEKYKAMGFSE